MIAGPHWPLDVARPRRPRALQHARRHLAALASAALRVRSGHDREAIHDLRVATRRLSSTLAAWEHALDSAAIPRARRDLRRLRKRLSRAREREVLAEQFEALLEGEPLSLRAAGLPELARLERRVAADRLRARRAVRPSRIERLVLRLEAVFPETRGAEAPVDLATARTTERRVAAIDALGRAGEGDDDALHRARIALKRWRYQLEAIADPSDEDATARLSALRALQQCLGALHDAAVLREFISRRAARAKEKRRGARHEALVALLGKADQARWRAREGLPAAAAAVSRGV